MKSPSLWTLTKKTLVAWHSHDVTRVGAALAFYALLSLAPLLTFFIPVSAYIFRREGAEQLLGRSTDFLVGPEGGQAVHLLVSHAGRISSGIVTDFLAIGTLLFGSLAAFDELRNAINAMWNISASAPQSLGTAIRRNLFAVGIALVTGSLLLISIALTAAFARISAVLQSMALPTAGLVEAVNFLVSLGVMSVITAIIFRFVPDVRIAWRDISVGVAVTAFLLIIGKSVFGFYVGRFGLSSMYGAAGSLVAFAVWVYYSAQIVLLGAEATRIYAQERQGEKASPQR
ncbi:MAG TPA: YihY/virulence factor BrkB family protein [Terriglobia bacterium]|nr:YihY/virulence factor BrkB family protein [Terriglobia bacterium]